MNQQEYYNTWKNVLLAQNKTFDTDKNWSVNGSSTILNKQAFIKHSVSWKRPISLSKPKKIPKIAFFTLIYGDVNEKWLTDCVESALWQISYFNYKLVLIFVLDPPCTNSDMVLRKLEQKYKNFNFRSTDFIIVENEIRRGWCGSYNMALDIAKQHDCDMAIVSDSDDISHPERLLWSWQLFENNPDIVCTTFIPILIYGDQPMHETEEINPWHPHIFNDSIMTFVESVLLFTITGNSFSAFNPNVISVNREVIENVRFRPEIVNDSNNINPADQLFIYEIIKKYPFGCMPNDRVMQIYRYHDNNHTLHNDNNKWENVLYWKKMIAREIKQAMFKKHGTNYIEDVMNHCKSNYGLDLDFRLFQS